jgi:hypothetical protein
MKALFVYENIDFERGEDPKKSMGIGKWANKQEAAYNVLREEFIKELENSGYKWKLLDESPWNIRALVVIPSRDIHSLFSKKIDRVHRFMHDVESIFEDSFFVEAINDEIFQYNYEVGGCHVKPVSEEYCDRYGVPWGSVYVEAIIGPIREMSDY